MAEPVVEQTTTGSVEGPAPSMFMSIINEIIYSPMNLGLVLIIAFLVYKIIRDRFEVPTNAGPQKPAKPELPKMRRDFSIQDLKPYDGTQQDGRVLLAVNGNVYDVTKATRFYGPGGPYASLAGRDASRNLATFSVEPNNKEEYDDLSDLSAMEMDSVREWDAQFKEKYDLVGKLLRKGEQPTNYEDEEEDTAADAKATDTLTSEPPTDADGVRKRQVDAAVAAAAAKAQADVAAQAPSHSEAAK